MESYNGYKMESSKVGTSILQFIILSLGVADGLSNLSIVSNEKHAKCTFLIVRSSTWYFL